MRASWRSSAGTSVATPARCSWSTAPFPRTPCGQRWPTASARFPACDSGSSRPRSAWHRPPWSTTRTSGSNATSATEAARWPTTSFGRRSRGSWPSRSTASGRCGRSTSWRSGASAPRSCGGFTTPSPTAPWPCGWPGRSSSTMVRLRRRSRLPLPRPASPMRCAGAPRPPPRAPATWPAPRPRPEAGPPPPAARRGSPWCSGASSVGAAGLLRSTGAPAPGARSPSWRHRWSRSRRSPTARRSGPPSTTSCSPGLRGACGDGWGRRVPRRPRCGSRCR
jgi:hypothetical protein